MTPQRITLSRTKGWRMPPNTRVVTRATIFGNPFAVGDPGRWWVPNPDGSRGWDVAYLMPAMNAYQAVTFFSAWLHQPRSLPAYPTALNGSGKAVTFLAMSNRREEILARLPYLRGMNLACFCKPGCPCHADVLLELANR